MTSEVIPFTFQQYSIRTTLIEGEPWFCLADVCAVLSVDRTSDLLRNLDAKGVVKNPTLTQGGEQQVKFVNEPNLYRVIFRFRPVSRQTPCRREAAPRFERSMGFAPINRCWWDRWC